MIILFNEYLSYRIASLIGVSAPAAGLAIIDDDTVLEKTSGIKAIQPYKGICFYSEYIPKAIAASWRTLKRTSNLQDACLMVLLDEIIRNCDRHSSNVLLSADVAYTEFYVIDHSHALGDPEWEESELTLNDLESPNVWRENKDLYNMFVRAGARIDHSQLNSASKHIKKVLTEDALESIFQDIPVEWTKEIGISKVQGVKQYIMNRVNHLDVICKVICAERGA